MNTARLKTAADVVFAAMQTRQTAAGIAAALEAACFLQSPESAAETRRLRAQASEARQLSNDLDGANLARWEEKQTSARLRLALKSARRGRRKLRARADEAEARLAQLEMSALERAETGLKRLAADLQAERPPVCPVCQHIAAECTCFGKTPGGAS